MAKPSSLDMTLLTHRRDGVLYAEVGKEVVDEIFGILLWPVATVINKNGDGVVESVQNIHKSVKRMSDDWFQTKDSKDALLKPQVPNHGDSSHAITKMKLYNCGQGCKHFADERSTICPKCQQKMETSMTYAAPALPLEQKQSNERGFVMEGRTYMVMDNLEIMPLSTIKSALLLKKYQGEEVDKLEEKVVRLGTAEFIQLVKASFHSDHVLTDVFIEAEAEAKKAAKAKAEAKKAAKAAKAKAEPKPKPEAKEDGKNRGN